MTEAPGMMSVCTTMPSPVGKLTLVASDAGLTAVLWEGDDPGRVRRSPLAEEPSRPVLREAEHQLAAYFAGTRTAFSLPLDLQGTAFQRKVWAALLTIPFGETRSYGQIARQIGHPDAARAVGAANGRNPIAIIAPCHRVIGAAGTLTGFAGGLEAKSFLLALESGSLPVGADGGHARLLHARSKIRRATGPGVRDLFAAVDRGA